MSEDEALLATVAGAIPDELARTLELSPDGLVALARTVEQRPRSTIEPAHDRASTAGRRALVDLEGERTEARLSGALDLGATIGEGGMGVVRSATQRSLGRRVAVKTLRPGARSEQATVRLLREAWVTGSLEHPNIVPVYDLGLDADGTPVIVLKHIEGRPWSELIADAGATSAASGGHGLLDQNLRILIQLCNAVSLAHARGILHRDLKPENVMIGRFGEVYLVDWGIAVSLRPDPSGRLPLAADAKELAGTPAYMAPEMLGGGTLDERTDVYLLGATLHEVLVGRPPHVGGVFQQILVSVLRSSPSFPEHVPTELAAIAARAMSRRPEDRFASADELRQRLEWYIQHRGSLALSAEAARRLGELRAVLAREGEPDAVRERVHHLFAEARFAFRQAIVASGDNDAARAGLVDLTELVVDFELERGTAEAAAAALAELESPRPELSARVAEAMRRREEEKARVAALEELRADLDPAIGRKTRMFVGALMALVWTIYPLVCARVAMTGRWTSEWAPTVVTGLVFAFGGAVMWWGRESLAKTAVNRLMQAVIVMMFSMQFVLQLGGVWLGLTLHQIIVLHLFCWVFAAAVFVVFIERAVWPSVLGYLGAFLWACRDGEQLWILMSASNAILTVNVLVAWLRPRSDGAVVASTVLARTEAERRGPGRP